MKVEQTSQLLDKYVAILGQTEHTTKLLLSPEWEGAEAVSGGTYMRYHMFLPFATSTNRMNCCYGRRLKQPLKKNYGRRGKEHA